MSHENLASVMKCFHTLDEIYFLSVSDVIHPAAAVVLRLSGRGQTRSLPVQ